MISESGLWRFVRIATIISLNVNIRRYVCHSIDIRDGICSKCCFVDTNICSNMRCFSSVREDDKSVIFKKIEL